MSVIETTELRHEDVTGLVPLAHFCRTHAWDRRCLPDRSNCATYCGATESHYSPDDPIPPERDCCQVCRAMWLEERRS